MLWPPAHSSALCSTFCKPSYSDLSSICPSPLGLDPQTRGQEFWGAPGRSYSISTSLEYPKHVSSLTSLLPHAHRQDHGTEDVESPDDPRSDHVGISLCKREGSGEGRGSSRSQPGQKGREAWQGLPAAPPAYRVRERPGVVGHV